MSRLLVVLLIVFMGCDDGSVNDGKQTNNTTMESVCGNGIFEGREGYEMDDDGNIISYYGSPVTCEDFAFDGGTLILSDDCRVDFTDCICLPDNPYCNE